MIGSMAPGTKVQIEVNREVRRKCLMSSLLKCLRLRPSRRPKRPLGESAQPEKTTVFGAVVVADANRLRLICQRKFRVPSSSSSTLHPPAAKGGLREGDVIQEANKQLVKNAKDLGVALSEN